MKEWNTCKTKAKPSPLKGSEEKFNLETILNPLVNGNFCLSLKLFQKLLKKSFTNMQI